jgi:hypothetical protein
MGRLWQTLILTKWNPIFANIPVESLIYQNQKLITMLYEAVHQTDSAPFIEFILQMIFDAIQSSSTTDQVTVHDTDQAIVQDGDHVQRLFRPWGKKNIV